ncbi:MAG: dihydrodipicolinate reductase C-terminal domain-containing protein [Pseudomonadota bacterium]
MVKIGVVGYSGRVNNIVIEEIEKNNQTSLSGIYVKSEKLNEAYKFPLYDNIKELAKISDAIIDFSNPKNTLNIAKQLVGSDIILVSGTTGFSVNEFEEFKSYSKYLTIIWSANMSIGINLLHRLLKLTSSRLGDEFDSAIIDIHHQHKKDSPSGTALSLAQTIIDNSQKNPQISSLRLGEELGSHEVIFSGPDDSIILTHKTYSRKSYAKGAIAASLWGLDKEKGFYSMLDVLDS